MTDKIHIPEIVKSIAIALKSNGNQAFIVGGAVRDAAMCVGSKDVDIATDLFVDDVIILLKDQPFTKDIKRTGDKFPVARIFTNCDNEFEIATFRCDIGTGKETDFKISSNIEEDVKRRDFTFNALFADAVTGEIIDLAGGMNDLSNKIIRFVGDPVQRIMEDRTRLLRLVRFKERFGFDVADLEIIKQNNSLIEGLEEKDQVKKEMIVTELIKGFSQARDKISFFQSLSDLGLLSQAFPDCNTRVPKFSFDHINLMLFQVLKDNDLENVLSTMRKMTWSKDDMNAIKCLFLIKKSDFEDSGSLSRLVRLIDESGTRSLIDDFSTLFNSEKIEHIRKFKSFKTTVKNTDFPNIKSGPDLGRAIHDREIELFNSFKQ